MRWRRRGGAGAAREWPPLSAGALAVFTVASAAGLLRVFAGHSWVGPVLATALVAHLVLWLLRRQKAGPAATIGATAAAVLLSASWTVLASTTWYGIPAGGTWSHAVTALGGVGGDGSWSTPPVQATTGLVLLCTLTAAAIAVLADVLAFRLASPLAALLPGVAGFACCGVAGRGAGRAELVAAEVAAGCAFLLAQRKGEAQGQVWMAATRGARWASGAGALTSVAAVAVAVALVPALPSRDGSTPFGWGSGDGGNRIVPNPLVTMQTQLHVLSKARVFEVTSQASSYWRLTSLDDFDGNTWSGTGSYAGFRSRLPGVPEGEKGVGVTKATFQIQQLDSVWLPDQFDPASVSGVRHVSYDAQSDSLITSDPTSDGLTYTVTSYRYLSALNAADLESAPSTTEDPAVSADLELPATVAGPITQLASSLTAGKADQYAKALAIEQYLRGPKYHYSLDPPSDGSSRTALVNFLFDTRTGYCQQFAGAFAVLARVAGLPTRLAVGYTTGKPIGGDPSTGETFQVTGADAHTWPEVYFGAGIGWVPFEPTPGFGVPGTSTYDPSSVSGSGSPSPSVTPANQTPGSATTPSDPGPALPKSSGRSTPHPAHAAKPATATGHRSAWARGWLWLLAVGALAALGLFWISAVSVVKATRRRTARRRAARGGPAAMVLGAWDEARDELSWRKVARRPAETLDEFTARAVVQLGGGEAVVGLAQLCRLTREAVFAPAVSSSDAGRAAEAAAQVRRGLRSSSGAVERIARSASPRRGRPSQLRPAAYRGAASDQQDQQTAGDRGLQPEGRLSPRGYRTAGADGERARRSRRTGTTTTG